MSWFDELRGRRRRDRGGGRGYRAPRQGKKRKGDGCDCGGDCCDLDCFSFLALTTVLRALLGMFAPSAVDPHTLRPHSPGARLAARLVRSYQLNVSARRATPVCNLAPSCSRYALQVVSTHGLLRGGVLVARRLRECRAAGRTRSTDGS
ncbi:membrane protein insertion efficiency factor YidD [Nocardioides zeae]|uniref:Membrane protein insertion efficiency factor YidD n=1 Tax=Nocardioides imazamoxiresistens TaxID=3231893 RepID=A0ABU3PXM3_9ACTN|nr:membrane protein insertion efficiency factor YidD [Nocardioides zeae]MDT9593987.1 membrane protein insertion efficiency factor YidD [Nocardioides zeae]